MNDSHESRLQEAVTQLRKMMGPKHDGRIWSISVGGDGVIVIGTTKDSLKGVPKELNGIKIDKQIADVPKIG
jgi:hypothetical protein